MSLLCINEQTLKYCKMPPKDKKTKEEHQSCGYWQHWIG